MPPSAAGVGAGGWSLLPFLGTAALFAPAVVALSFAIGDLDSITLHRNGDADNPDLERDRARNAAIRAAEAPTAFGAVGGASKPLLNLFAGASPHLPQRRQEEVDLRIAPLLAAAFASAPARGSAAHEGPLLADALAVADFAPGWGNTVRLAALDGASQVARTPRSASRSTSAPSPSNGAAPAGGMTRRSGAPSIDSTTRSAPPAVPAPAPAAPMLTAPERVVPAPATAATPPPPGPDAPRRIVQTEGATHLADETMSAPDGFLFQGGDVRGNGAFAGPVQVDGATLAAGNSPGVLVFESGLIFSSGVLEVEFATPESHDFYDVTGTAEFTGGLFRFVFFEGFTFDSAFTVSFLVADDIVGFDEAPPVAYEFAGADLAFGVFDVFLEVFEGRERLALAFAPTPLRPAEDGPAAQDAVATPEPAGVGLFGLSLLAGLYAVRRRKRTASSA